MWSGHRGYCWLWAPTRGLQLEEKTLVASAGNETGVPQKNPTQMWIDVCVQGGSKGLSERSEVAVSTVTVISKTDREPKKLDRTDGYISNKELGCSTHIILFTRILVFINLLIYIHLISYKTGIFQKVSKYFYVILSLNMKKNFNLIFIFNFYFVKI